MADRAVGIDIGGTKVAVGVVDADGVVLTKGRIDTPADQADAAVDAIAHAVSSLGDMAAGLPMGVGAAGLVDSSGTVRYAPNLAWRDYPLADALHERLGVPVTVDNDGNTAAWAEYRVGAAGDAASTALMVTVGTGIGGGLVVGGELVRGAMGYAAEFGHMVVAEGGRQCGCGNHGCLEAMASGTAIGRTLDEWRRDGRVPADSILSAFDEVSGAAVGRAAKAGDATAKAVVAECGRWLGVGIASLVNALDPEVVVIGGGVAALGDTLLLPARAACNERVLGASYRTLPPIVPTVLEADGGFIGAALLALDETSTSV